MAGVELGISSLATGDVESATTPLITQIIKINLYKKEIEEVQKRFNDFIDTITVDNTSAKLEEFKGMLNDRTIEKMEAYYKQEEKNLQNVTAHLPDQKSFLTRFSLQEVMVRMLKDIAKYVEFLKLFIKRFNAHKEHIESKKLRKNETATGKTKEQKDKTKKQRRPKINNDQRTMRELDTPLHCAVRQLNKGFIEWLLEQPETEINLRNKRRETALAILCQMYDWCKELVPKLKTRVDDIEKERETADKTQQISLDEEKIEVTNQMNAPTHIMELIKILLVKGAQFNIYMNDGALPFDFLWKYDTETDVADIINSYVKSNVAMTVKAQKQLNTSAEDKKVSKKRIVKFYKKTEDMNVGVTVELLEIFIWFKDLEKFKHYWKDFKVTGDNVKKVITLLLHVAVELNYTTYVEHIIKKASEEIFKLEENKATDIRSVIPERNHICWCSFKCCQKRHYPNSQTRGEEFELRVSDSLDKCEFMSERSRWCCFKCCQNKQNPSSSEGVDFQTQGETFKQDKNEKKNSQDTCAGTSTGGSCKELTIESQDNQPESQDNHGATTEETSTTDQQPSGWCCLKCFQKKQNSSLPDGTNPRELTRNSKDCRLTKGEENKMVHRNELRGLLKMVCLNGNKTLLNMFFKMMNDRLLVNENPLLINTLNGAYTMKQKKKDFLLVECIKLLINNHSKVDMYRVDKNGNTALHLALSYGYDKIALLMLKKIHGLIGFKNRQNKTPIEYGTTEFWNSYLDSCISTNKNESELRFNVGFLKPRATDESSDTSKSSSAKWYPRWIKYRFTHTVNDMTALRLISQSKDRKEFLMHPVIIAFITMKWKRLFHWHMLNLLLTTFTLGTCITYTLMSCPSGLRKYGFMACIGACMQFLLRWSYVTVENIIDIIHVVLIVIVLGCGCESDGWCEYVPIYSSFVVISLSLQATFLLGASWNSLSITLYMFKTVSSSFFKSFLSFTPLIGAFIYSYYRINNQPSGISVSNGTKSNSTEENFNNFHSAWDATIKTLVMTTGEFEAANNYFKGERWLLFVAFLFIPSVVILNLINGIAVSDIAAIRKESEFISVYKIVKLVELYERSIVEFFSTMSGCLPWLFRETFLPYPFFEKYECIVYVMVNEKNKLAIKSNRKDKSTKEVIPAFPWLPSWFLYMSFDQSYVDMAKTIARSHSKNNSGRGTNELADTEQTDKIALVNKTAMNQHKTSTLSSPSVPASRDAQIEMLQGQVRSMIAMLNDIQQQLAEKPC